MDDIEKVLESLLETPAKPNQSRSHGGQTWWYECPTCSYSLDYKEQKCPWCHQVIDWKDGDGDG